MPDQYMDGHDGAFAAPAPANGVACAFAILIDRLEDSGALRPGAYEEALRAVLQQAGLDRTSQDGRFLNEILTLLAGSANGGLRVIDGGKNQSLESC